MRIKAKPKYTPENQSKMDIESKIMNYLIRKINSNNFILEDLTRDSITKTLQISDKNLVKEVIEELENDGKIVVKETEYIFYIPKSLEKSEAIKRLRLQRIGQWYTRIYIVGMVFELILVSFLSVNQLTSYLYDTNISFLMLKIFVIGLITPLILGRILISIYLKILTFISMAIFKLGFGKVIDKTQLNYSLILALILLVVYFLLSAFMTRPVTPFEIVSIFGIGFAAASYIISRSKKK